MSRRYARVTPALALALAVAALAVAGCGGGSSGSGTGTSGAGTSGAAGGTLSAQAYASQLKSIGLQMKALGAQYSSAGQDPNAWLSAATKLKAITAKAAALNPPAKFVSLNAAIVSGLQRFAANAQTIGNSLKSGDTAAAKRELIQWIHSALALQQKITSALLQAVGTS